MADKKVRSIAKTFSWRLFIFIYWVIFGYIYTGTFTELVYWVLAQLFLFSFIIFMKEFGIKLNGELAKT